MINFSEKKRLTAIDELSLWKEYGYPGICRKRNIQARNRLIEHHLNLAAWWTRKRFKDETAFNDAMSFACAGLIRAIDRFDYRKGYKFTTFAWKPINQELNKQYKKIVSSNRIRAYNGDIGEFYLNKAVDTNLMIQNIEDKEYICRIKDALIYLPERERILLERRFGINDGIERTLDNVGEFLNLSKESVRQIQNRAIKTIKKML